MGFIVGVVAALLVTFLLTYITVKKPVFGRILIAISVSLVLLSIFSYFQKDKRVEKQQQRIALEEIVITDVQFDYAYGSFYKLSGTIANHSNRYRLQAVNLKIAFYKCPDVKSHWQDCELINDMAHTIKTRLAAKQTAPFETYLLLDQKNYRSLRLKTEIISGVAR